MASEWAKRFYDNIDPPSDKRGFDGISSGTRDSRKKGNEALNLADRMDELQKRISHHAAITATLSLPSSYLAWNKNPQCPQRTWTYSASSMPGTTEEAPTEGEYDDSIDTGYYYIDTPSRKFVPRPCSWNATNTCTSHNSHKGWIIQRGDRRLVVPRHTYYDYTLWASDYVENYFPKSCQDGKHIIAYGGANTGFWLIDANEADFVYAILKSSMFRRGAN